MKKDPIKSDFEHKKRLSFYDSPKERDKSEDKMDRRRQNSFSKSVSKAIGKIGSMRMAKNTVGMSNEILRYKTEHLPTELAKSHPKKETKPIAPIFTPT